MKRTFLILLFILNSNILFADTHIAASCSLADVQAAIMAASAGDTVIVPAGTATWAGQLSITIGINLIGAGIGNTIITSNYAGGEPSWSDRVNSLLIYEPATPALNTPFRLSGFSFDFDLKCQGIGLFNDTIVAQNKMRIDHCNFIDPRTRMFVIQGTWYGAVDNNQFHSQTSGATGLISSYGAGVIAWQNLAFSFGTADNIYYEDNEYWIRDYAHDSSQGGRYCVRHNTFHYDHPSAGLFPWFDAHGNMGTGMNLGTMGTEIYENTVDAGNHAGRFFDDRGGMMLAYNNTFNTTSSVDAIVREEHNDNENPPATGPTGQPQYVSKSYYWNNKKNGTTQINVTQTETIDYGGEIGIVPQANRDYWDYNASFNGSSGVGVGLLSARPSSGLTVGVGYWATDTNTLYRATGTTTWEAYYTPYTYPHPLRAAMGDNSNTVLQPGTKIRVEAGGKIVIKEQ